MKYKMMPNLRNCAISTVCCYQVSLAVPNTYHRGIGDRIYVWISVSYDRMRVCFFLESFAQTISPIKAPVNIPILEIPHQDKLCFISFRFLSCYCTDSP